MEKRNGFKISRRTSTGDLNTNSLSSMFSRLSIQDPLTEPKREQSGKPQTSPQTQKGSFQRNAPYQLKKASTPSGQLNQPGPSSMNGSQSSQKYRG